MVDVLCCLAAVFMNQRYMFVTHLDIMALTYSCLSLGPVLLLLTAFTEGTSQINFRNTGTASIVEDG
jgi:hypothetical protein